MKVTIIWSLRFESEMKHTAYAWERTFGTIVYTPIKWIKNPDDVIRKRIDESDAICVYNGLVDGIPYVWKSTKSEIEYAKKQWKEVVLLFHADYMNWEVSITDTKENTPAVFPACDKGNHNIHGQCCDSRGNDCTFCEKVINEVGRIVKKVCHFVQNK